MRATMAKRPAPYTPADVPVEEAEADSLVRRSELDTLLAGWADEVKEHQTKTTTDSTNKYQESLANMLGKYDARANERFMAVETSVANLADNHDKLATEQADLRAQVQQLTKAMAVAEATVLPNKADPADFDRKIDGTIIRINTNSLVSLEALTAVVADAWTSVGINPNSVKVTGPKIGKLFVARFEKNDANTAARRVRKTMDGLRNTEGVWKKFQIPSPGGELVEAYLDMDKSPQTKKQEAAARRLSRCFKEAVDQPFHLNKKDSTISMEWMPIARIECPDADSTKVFWNYAAVRKLEIKKTWMPETKKKIMELFDANGDGGSTSTEWSL